MSVRVSAMKKKIIISHPFPRAIWWVMCRHICTGVNRVAVLMMCRRAPWSFVHLSARTAIVGGHFTVSGATHTREANARSSGSIYSTVRIH